MDFLDSPPQGSGHCCRTFFTFQPTFYIKYASKRPAVTSSCRVTIIVMHRARLRDIQHLCCWENQLLKLQMKYPIPTSMCQYLCCWPVQQSRIRLFTFSAASQCYSTEVLHCLLECIVMLSDASIKLLPLIFILEFSSF